jgi:Tfp pilus assembly protein PilF
MLELRLCGDQNMGNSHAVHEVPAMTRFTLVFAFLVIGTTFAVAGDDESWVGQKVMKRRPDVKFADYNPDGTVREVNMSDAVVKVLREKDGWLRVRSPGTEAWVLKTEMVLMRDAPAHYTEYLRGKPDSAWAWGMRGSAWRDRGEFDIAIKDYTEAIRLEPSAAAHFSNRGIAWADKKEYDKAIHDFDEAIRLDSKDEYAFHGRGIAWAKKKDYEKAIHNFDEAIRLNPKDTFAFYNRGWAWYLKKEYDKAITDLDEAIRLDPMDASGFNGKAWLLATCPVAGIRNGKRAVELARKAC